MMHSNDVYLIDNLPIQINGNEKYATGLTKRTTIDDVKYAILSCTMSSNDGFNLNDYAIFEKWQGNERILDGKLKIYKLIRLWKSLPGNQLENVKFIIKKRKSYNQIQQNYNQYILKQQQLVHNTASPAMNKTWNSNKAANALRKSSRKLSTRDVPSLSHSRSASSSSLSSVSDNEEKLVGTSNDSSENDEVFGLNRYDKRYSSIKKFNRSKKSTVNKQHKTNDKVMLSNTNQEQDRRQTFLNLVQKQNEIIDKQMNKIEHNDKQIKKCMKSYLKKFNSQESRSRSTKRSKSLDKYDAAKLTKSAKKAVVEHTAERSSSIRRLIVKDDETTKQPQQQQQLQFTSNDIKQAFDNVLDEKQLNEYVKLCNNYFQVQKNVNLNKRKIDDLNNELVKMKASTGVQQIKDETTNKIETCVQTYDKQNEKLLHLSDALNRIDEIILLKTSLINSLENELKKIENEQLFDLQAVNNNNNNKKMSTFASTSSTSSSVSSVITSVSQQGEFNSQQQQQTVIKSKHFADNDSDTGISSANSDDFTSHLETLV